MNAMVIHEFGGPEVFRPAEVPKPDARPGHVVIRVEASSVNPVDTKIRRGVTPWIAPDFPAILHGDVAGIIEGVGEGVSGFRPGDEVYACAGGVRGQAGALADFMLADADLVALKPKSLSMAGAAALPLVGITAWEALIDRVRVGEGDKVLVHAAAGGVGHIGIQLAKWAGAEVFTTGSSERKLALGREFGADVGINYRETPVAEYVAQHTGGTGFDIVFDTVGGESLDASLEAVKLLGTVVTISARSTRDLTPLHAKALTLEGISMLIPMLHGTGRARHGEILTRLAELVDEGVIRPLVDEASFSFAEAGAAHARLEGGEAIGKISLTR